VVLFFSPSFNNIEFVRDSEWGRGVVSDDRPTDINGIPSTPERSSERRRNSRTQLRSSGTGRGGCPTSSSIYGVHLCDVRDRLGPNQTPYDSCSRTTMLSTYDRSRKPEDAIRIVYSFADLQ
jgi:hypothetical protein